MRKLTEKAEGRKLTRKKQDAWKKGVIQIYNSKSYTWNPQQKQMHIFPTQLYNVTRGQSNTARIRKKYHKKTRKKR